MCWMSSADILMEPLSLPMRRRLLTRTTVTKTPEEELAAPELLGIAL